MEYDKTQELTCPKDGKKTTHTITYQKATCSRFRDTVSWFFCEKDGTCQECRENYE